MQELLNTFINDYYFLILIFGGVIFFGITWAILDNIMEDRHLRDIYRILKNDTTTKNDKLIIALALKELGMRGFLKVINGVYDE